jgi:hypothetical protein
MVVSFIVALLVGLVVIRYDRTAAPISSVMARSVLQLMLRRTRSGTRGHRAGRITVEPQQRPTATLRRNVLQGAAMCCTNRGLRGVVWGRPRPRDQRPTRPLNPCNRPLLKLRSRRGRDSNPRSTERPTTATVSAPRLSESHAHPVFKPAGRSSPPRGGFDSFAAPLRKEQATRATFPRPSALMARGPGSGDSPRPGTPSVLVLRAPPV